MTSEPQSRAMLRTASRVVIKCGTSIVTNENGEVSLIRLGAVVEQISELVKNGTEVIFVSSGAVGMGKRLLRKQGQMNLSLNELHTAHESSPDSGLNGIDHHLRHSDKWARRSSSSRLGGKGFATSESFSNLLDPANKKANKKEQYDSACAAAGQLELINFYTGLFGQRDVACSQILVTNADFQDEVRKNNLRYAIDRLLSVGIVPIVNENDAVSANVGYTSSPNVFSDNDSLSALCARSFDAQVVLMLTDVPGVYDRPPTEDGAKMFEFYMGEEESIKIGEKSIHGKLTHDMIIDIFAFDKNHHATDWTYV